jgi:hypothetical protein
MESHNPAMFQTTNQAILPYVSRCEAKPSAVFQGPIAASPLCPCACTHGSPDTSVHRDVHDIRVEATPVQFQTTIKIKDY